MKRLLFISAVLFITACSEKPGDKKAQLEKLKKERNELDVKITKLESETGNANTLVKEVSVYGVHQSVFKSYVEIQGKIDAEQNVMVNPEAQGVVNAVYVTIGQQVGKGQVLAQIDDNVLRQSIAQLQTQLDLANNLFNRQKNLWDQKIGTEVQYLNAKSQKEGLERQMKVLRSQQSMYKIKSPISGTIDQMDMKIGQAVMPGMSGIRVINSNDLKAKALVAESYAGRVNQGDDVLVIIPDIPDSINTKVTFVSKVIDPASRSFNLEVKLPSNKRYHPNMIAILKVIDYKNTKALTIPVNAIQKSENEEYVFIAENGNAKKVVIKQGRTADGQAEILTGLKEGDNIITSGIQDLNEGDTVKFK